MRKTFSLVLGSIVVIILVAHQLSVASTSVNDDSDNGPAKPEVMGCAPLQDTAFATTSKQDNFEISTFLSDSELSKFKYESFIFTLGPGGSDTISHRHDCDVFVNVLEGTLLFGQEFNKPDTVRAGEIFHEKRNVIHSVSTNPSKDTPMKALIVSIRKDGRAFYTPLYPKK